jgi:hypothetical protein
LAIIYNLTANHFNKESKKTTLFPAIFPIY